MKTLKYWGSLFGETAVLAQWVLPLTSTNRCTRTLSITIELFTYLPSVRRNQSSVFSWAFFAVSTIEALFSWLVFNHQSQCIIVWVEPGSVIERNQLCEEKLWDSEYERHKFCIRSQLTYTVIPVHFYAPKHTERDVLSGMHFYCKNHSWNTFFNLF